MLFWIFMLFMTFITPAVMILLGSQFVNSPPKKVNNYFGYRTHRSMMNEDTWHFAHVYIGGLWKKCGWIVLIFSVPIMMLCVSEEILKVSIFGIAIISVQSIVMVVSFKSTEKALLKNFDRRGNRRDLK